MRGLYPIVDVDTLAPRGVPVIEFAERILSTRPALMQLRAKHATAAETLGWLQALRAPCARAGTLLFANDRPDLALIAGCDGVHVGQDDLSVAEVRRLSSELMIGVSTHGVEQLQRALEQRPNYVAFGPIFATRSKARADAAVGLAGLAEAAHLTRQARLPLVAIGGITRHNAAAVTEHADLIAVIAELAPAGHELEHAAERALELGRVIGQAVQS